MQHSEKIFKKNVDLLGRIIPQIALKLPYVDPAGCEFCKSRSGALNLIYEEGGKQHHVHANYDPAKEAEKWFQGVDLNGTDVLCVYGVGLGYYFDAAKKWLEEDIKHYLLFIEDDPRIMRRFMETEKATELLDHKQVQVHFFDTWATGRSMLDWVTWFFVMLHWEVTALDHYRREKEEKYTSLKSIILHTTVNKNSMESEYLRHGGGFFVNYYANILYVEKSRHANKMFSKFKGVPAIICGAGPSLGKHIEDLDRLKNQALIFAGGSAMNTLTNFGVTPHFGAGIDPNMPQLERLASNKAYEVPFFFRNRMNHEAFQYIHGEKLFINGAGGYDISDYFEEELGIEDIIIDEGCNVINLCMEIAKHLGCNPIIFVGMDLAYTGMKSYAPGVVKDASVSTSSIVEESNINAAAFIRKDIYGDDIYTLWKWVSESEWISSYAKNNPGLHFVNATEGGIGFRNVENLSLKEAEEKYLTVSYDLQGRVHSEIQNASFQTFEKGTVIDLLETLYKSLEKVRELVKELGEETDAVEEKIKKGGQLLPDLKTGRVALLESDMFEEVGYKFVLQVMVAARNRILDREFYLIRHDKSLKSETQRNLKRLEIDRERYAFVEEAAKFNQQTIYFAVKKYKKRGLPITPFFEKLNLEEVQV